MRHLTRFSFALLVLSIATPLAVAGETPDDDTLKTLLDTALHDEYRAEDTYAAVIEDHGEVRPFSNIVNAEDRHSQHLLTLYASRDWDAPNDPYAAGEEEVPHFDTLLAACKAGVKGEIDNVAIYEEALEKYDLPDDVQQIFTILMEASRDRHLPAFQRCVDRGGTPGRGQGGPGKGQGRAQ